MSQPRAGMDDLEKRKTSLRKKIKKLDASNIQNLFCHKTIHVSGIFCAHHQELSTVHLAIGTFHALMMGTEDARNM